MKAQAADDIDIMSENEHNGLGLRFYLGVLMDFTACVDALFPGPSEEYFVSLKTNLPFSGELAYEWAF